MRLVFGLVLLIGVGLAGFAVFLAQGYVSKTQAQLERERANRQVVVPMTDIYIVNKQLQYGDRLTAEDIELVSWPETHLPEGTFAAEEEVFPKGPEVLRTVLRTIEKNEALLAVKVTEAGEDAGVSSRLTKGMRAFAIRVDVASGVSGFLAPGDRVDVYWTGSAEFTSGEEQEVTQLIQPNIRLIAVDQSAGGDRDGPTVARTVTVEATQRQVAVLAQAQATGTLSLALLGTADEGSSEDVNIDQAELLGIQQGEVVQRERVCTVRTRKGAEVVEIPIPCTD